MSRVNFGGTAVPPPQLRIGNYSLDKTVGSGSFGKVKSTPNINSFVMASDRALPHRIFAFMQKPVQFILLSGLMLVAIHQNDITNQTGKHGYREGIGIYLGLYDDN